MTKPYFFCDFDGVLNVFPYEQEYTGPKLNGMWDPAGNDPKNWKITEIEPDPTKHFVWDEETTVPHISYPDKTLRLRWSSELINNIKALIESDTVTFMWLTTWNEHTVGLNKILGFPEETPFLRWWPRGLSDYSQSGKGNYLLKHMEKTNDTISPFIWVDDVATKSQVTELKLYPELFSTEDGYWVDRLKYEDEDSYKWKGSLLQRDPLPLVLLTNEKVGIARNQWAMIEKYIGSYGD